jgi:uncharacterized protein YggE
MKQIGKILLVFLLIAGTSLVVFERTGLPVMAEEDKVKGAMSFTGRAEVTAAPDVVYIELGAQTQADTVLEAQKKNTQVMSKVFASLEKAGLAKKDMETTFFNVEPVREYDEKTKRWNTVGYKAVNRIKVTLTDIDRAGEIIDIAIAAGATNVENVIFSVKDESQWKLKALEAALKDAQAKAKTAASVLDVKIVGVKSVTDKNSVNLYRYESMRALDAGTMLKASAGAPTPIQAGDVKIEASVEVTFAIQ